MKKTFTPILLSGLLAFSAASVFAQTSTGSTAAAPNQPAPVILLVPVEVSNRALDAGCWAQFYDERDFNFSFLTII